MPDASSSRSLPSIADVARSLERWAPPGTAQSYDNVGLQVGDASRPVRRAVVALDCTPQVVDEAEQRDASLIVSHHPLLFQPAKRFTAGSGPSGLAFRLAEAGLALYSIHTNLDAAPGGVSFALAEHLGLEDVGFLDTLDDALYKLVTFVPRDHLDAVRTALAEAGAGRIGEYEACAFAAEGTGYFRPGAGADPFTGTAAGQLEAEPEMRLEVELPRWELDAVRRALMKTHPYEEVAYDVYPVEQAYSRAGLGAVGSLAEPLPLAAFLQRVAARLECGSLRYVGDDAGTIERVAVCGGAGADFVRQAAAAGADAYVTSDVKYHAFFDVLDAEGRPRLAFIDAGHYETEWITEQLLVGYLKERFPQVEWLRTATRTSPVRSFVPTEA